MAYERTIATVRRTLLDTFDEVDRWFRRAEECRRFKPATGGWSIDEVLEHISLTNHFLMLTLRKWVAIAGRRSGRGEVPRDGESDLTRLEVIGERGSFAWDRPEHMEPSGREVPDEVRATLRRQLAGCLDLLEALGRGEGALCQIRMTVNELGRIDLYQWLYFLAQHARRHLPQMEAAEREFLQAATGSPDR